MKNERGVPGSPDRAVADVIKVMSQATSAVDQLLTEHTSCHIA